MAEQTVKLTVITDATGAITEMKKFNGEVEKMQSTTAGMIEKFKKNWLEVTAAIAVATYSATKALEYMDQGARAMQVESSFKIMAEAAGVHSKEMIASMKAATKATIDDSDLMQKASKLMLAGYNPDQIKRFSEGVVAASQYMGTGVSESFEKISDALASRMPKAMVQAGAVTKDQMKIVSTAIAAGADQATLMELVIANLAVKTLKLQGTQDHATISLQKFHAQQKETAESIGKGLIVVVDAAFRSFEYLSAGALGLGGNILFLAAQYAKYRAIVYETIGDEKKAAENRAFADDAMASSKAAWEARNELIKKAGQAIFLEGEIGKKASKDQIDAAQAVVDKQLAGLKALGESHKDASKNLNTAMEVNKKTYEKEIEMADHFVKMKVLLGENELNYILKNINEKKTALYEYYNASVKTIEDSLVSDPMKNAKQDELWAEYSKNWQKYINQEQEKAIQVNEFKMQAEQSYFTWAQKQLDDQLEYERTNGGKRIKNDEATWQAMRDFARMTGQQMTDGQAANAENTLNLFKQTYFGGTMSGLIEVQDAYANVGAAMENTTKKAFDNMTDALTEFVMTGKLDFSSLAQSIIKDMIRMQIQASITGPLAKAATGVSFAGIVEGLFGTMVAVAHSGGVVGETSFPTRSVFPQTFAAAPRLHGGLSADEFPAILQRGEAVIPKNRGVRGESMTPGDMAASQNKESSPVVINNNYFINAVDTKSFADVCKRNPGAFIGPITDNMKNNKIRSEWRSLLR